MKKSTDGSGGRRFRFPNLDEIKKKQKYPIIAKAARRQGQECVPQIPQGKRCFGIEQLGRILIQMILK